MRREHDRQATRARGARVVLVAIAAVALVVGVVQPRRGSADPGRPSRTPASLFSARTGAQVREEPLPRMFRVPELSAIDQHGAAFASSSLFGRPWVLDLVFTQCTSACPVLTSKMVMLQRELATVDARFVSLSVDPAHDDADALEAYAARWNADETRWFLLHAEPRQLSSALAELKLSMTSPPGEEIRHSTSFVLVDAEGWVRGHYDSNDPNALASLADHVRRLGRPLEHGDRREAPLARSLGCEGCHSDPKLAPPLDDLLGRTTRLSDGSTVVADEAYIRRSIVEPRAQAVAGYPSIMPSYEGALTREQLEALVREIATRRSVKPAHAHAPEVQAGAATAVVLDPVCHMEVRAAAGTPSLAGSDGGTIYFCSDACRDSYRRAH